MIHWWLVLPKRFFILPGEQDMPPKAEDSTQPIMPGNGLLETGILTWNIIRIFTAWKRQMELNLQEKMV